MLKTFVARIGGLAALALMCATGVAARDLRVMTFNVRYPNPDDGPNIWAKRRDLFVRTIRLADPDVIGTQELFQSQGTDVVRALPRYRWFGRDRFGGHGSEHMGIFYRTDRLRLVRQGDFWLSETPAESGSMGWGAALPRMVNWGIFQTRGPGSYRFLLMDTHFANRDAEDEQARRRSADLIARRLPALAQGLPIVLTGDFNAIPDSEAHRRLAMILTDVWQNAPDKQGPAGTFHDFSGTPGSMIDYIMVRGFRPIRAAVLTTHDGARYPSDHFPIVATLRHTR
ncbi:endonuclease/exonuclease/phosphatase family protein [Sphingomonas sp.]|uniref:endonuclease/exonuclease/phosphatase family protein n=1 Tax=Sphingomonas sp. TaxID=28214 RepID=UPI003B3B938C